MAKAQGDRLLDLEKLTTILNERVDALRAEINSCVGSQEKASESHGDLKVKFALVEQSVIEVSKWRDDFDGEDVKTRLALLEQTVAELKGTKDETRKWRWSLVPALLGAVLGSSLSLGGALLIRYLNKQP